MAAYAAAVGLLVVAFIERGNSVSEALKLWVSMSIGAAIGIGIGMLVRRHWRRMDDEKNKLAE